MDTPWFGSHGQKWKKTSSKWAKKVSKKIVWAPNLPKKVNFLKMASLIKNVKLSSLHWIPRYFNKLMRIHITRLKNTCTSIGTCYRLIKDHRSNVSKSLMHKRNHFSGPCLMQGNILIIHLHDVLHKNLWY